VDIPLNEMANTCTQVPFSRPPPAGGCVGERSAADGGVFPPFRRGPGAGEGTLWAATKTGARGGQCGLVSQAHCVRQPDAPLL